MKLARSPGYHILGFNPSYATYEYEAGTLGYLLKRAMVTILNESECDHVCKLLGRVNASTLAKSLRGILIITLGSRGARIYEKDSFLRVSSVAKRISSPFGAGDAFFAGFLQGILSSGSLAEAGAFASKVAARVVESPRVRARIDLRFRSQ